jgi:preprotein translocase subunit SecB
MSDTTATGAATGPSFLLRTQYIKDLSFENPQAPDIYRTLNKPPEVTVNIDVSSRPLAATDDYEIVMSIAATAKADGKDVFIVELTFGAVFQVAGFPADAMQPLLLIEIPRLMFPFARNIVAEVTRDSGFPPLLIHPVDFVAMYRQKFEAPAGQA